MPPPDTSVLSSAEGLSLINQSGIDLYVATAVLSDDKIGDATARTEAVRGVLNSIVRQLEGDGHDSSRNLPMLQWRLVASVPVPDQAEGVKG